MMFLFDETFRTLLYNILVLPMDHSVFFPYMKYDANEINIENKIFCFFRQNLNSDFTDSALGSSDKSPLPYGNFQLRDTTVHSILNHPRYGPK